MLRGIRNNNPGNVDYSNHVNWLGQIGLEEGPDARFIVFATMRYGIRCLAKILLNYVKIDKIESTVQTLVSRWAPGNENNTTAYVNEVCEVLGVEPNFPINLNDLTILENFVKAIIIQECGEEGFELITPDEITDGINLALGAI